VVAVLLGVVLRPLHAQLVERPAPRRGPPLLRI